MHAAGSVFAGFDVLALGNYTAIVGPSATSLEHLDMELTFSADVLPFNVEILHIGPCNIWAHRRLGPIPALMSQVCLGGELAHRLLTMTRTAVCHNKRSSSRGAMLVARTKMEGRYG